MSPADGAIALEPRDQIGGNAPPPFEAIRVHMDDLLVEALAWADGTTVETQAQADEASRLVDELYKAGVAADDVRGKEKAPLDAQIDEIQTRYNAYIAGLRAKHSSPGKVTKAIDALKACVKPYLDAQEALRLAAAEKARAEAIEAQRVASEAARAAQASNLAAQDAAEELVLAARRAEANARQIEQAKPQARGGDRAMGLKKTYTAELTDPKAAFLHYFNLDKTPFLAVALSLAQADVNNGRRTIPGVTVIEGTKL